MNIYHTLAKKQAEIPQYVEDDPWDGFFSRRFNDALNSTIYKVNYFVYNNPGKVFLAGVGLGGIAGFLVGFPAGAAAGRVLANL